MKHHFTEWAEDATGDAHAHCTRCEAKVRIAKGQSTTKFLVDGRWTAKRPPCVKPETKKESAA